MSSSLATPWSPVLSIIMDKNDLVSQEIIFFSEAKLIERK